METAQWNMILLILGLVCFLIGAFGVPTYRINIVALGLAFCVASVLISGGVVDG